MILDFYKNKKDILYIAIGILTCLIVGYVCLTMGRANIHADSAGYVRVYNSIFGEGHYPSSWNGANGELYIFHSAPIQVLMCALIKNKTIARAISAALVMLLVAACTFVFSRKYLKDNSWAIMLPLLYLVISGQEERDVIIYQACYVWQFIAFTIVLASFFSSFWDEKHSMKLYTHIPLLFLMAIDGIRYVAEFMLPLIAAIVFMVFVKYIVLREPKSEAIASRVKYFGFTTLLPFVLGYVVYKLICTTHNMNYSPSNGISITLHPGELFTNTKGALKSLFNIFGYVKESSGVGNYLAIIISVFIFIVLPILQLVRWKKESLFIQSIMAFGVFHNIEMLIIAIFMGKLSDRYLLSSVYIGIIFSSYYVYSLIKRSKIAYVIVSVCLVVLVAFYANSLIATTTDWKSILDSQIEASNELMGHGITKVYSDYWHAYPFEVYSNNKISAGGVKNYARKLEKWYWLCDDSAFEAKSGESAIIYTAEENDDVGQAVEVSIGTPSDSFTISDVYVYSNYNQAYYKTDLVVYVFDYDVCDSLTDGIRDGVLTVKDMDFNWIGTMTEDAIIMDMGGIVHGPWCEIAAGEYEVSISGSGLDHCEVYTTSESNIDGILCEVIDKTSDELRLHLSVDEYTYGFQFVITNVAEDTAEFTGIVIE